MKVSPTSLEGLLVIEPTVYQDERGFFLETYQFERYSAIGIKDTFVQDNHSHSSRGILRGMHFQVARPQAQLVTVMSGHIFDVCVDLRMKSPTFGKWFGVELHGKGARQIYMSPGFAHGFCVLSEYADLHYKVTQIYDGQDEGGLRWDDPEIGIKWPIRNPNLTRRDANYLTLNKLSEMQLPRNAIIDSK